MPPRYFLRLLGEPELRSPDGEPVRFRVRKHLALLAYFAAHRGQVYRRDQLAEFLWPDGSRVEGRHSVAVALSAIRGKLGLKTFECTRDTVRFVAQNLEVDLERLGRGEVLAGEFTPALEVDAFLGHFVVARAPEYMLWRDQMQARWLPQIQNALIVLMDRCRRTGDFTRIEPHAERLLALDEYSEQAIRARMEARAFAGDRLGAIRIYEEWRGRLASDLEAVPSALIEGMALRLRRRGFEPVGASRVPAVMTELWRDRAFIGRATQYCTLYESWERTRDGRNRHNLLLGESGVGKSTLAQRLATATALEGAVCSRVQCYEVEREIPYAAVGTLVRWLLEQPGAGGTPPEWLAELTRTVSAVRERFPNLPAPPPADGETIRVRLAEAVQQLAAAVAEEHPVILLVDDVHLADDASVAVLHVLMRRTESQRVMVLMTARREELDRSPHASRLIESRRHLALEVIEVPPFTPDEMHDLVTALGTAAGVPLPPPLRRALVRSANGIPMVAELMFDDWQRRGADCLALSLEAMTADLPGWSTEEVYGRLFQRTYDTLSAEARAVLNLAAILGERLNHQAMYELVDLTMGQRLVGALELARQRILVDTGQELQFRNELIRGYAYLTVPSSLRRALHGLVADRLLRDAESGTAVPGLTIAWHCFRGDRVAQAIPYLLAGGREAIEQGAPHATELALSTALPRLPAPEKAAAILLLAESLQEQGRWEESIETLVIEDYPAREWQLRRKVLCMYAESTLPHSERAAEALFGRLWAMVGEDLPPAEATVVFEALERVVNFTYDPVAAKRVLEWGIGIDLRSQSLSDRVRVAVSMVVLAWITRSWQVTPNVIDNLDSLAAEAETAGCASSSLARLQVALGSLLASVGNYDRAMTQYGVAREIYRQICNPSMQALAEANLSLCAGRLGNYGEQLSWAEKAVENLSPNIDAWTRTKITYRAAWAHAMLGDSSRAQRVLYSVGEFRDQESRLWARQAEGVTRADVLHVVGEQKLAIQVASEAIAETGYAAISRAHAGAVARWAVRVAERSGEIGKVREALGDHWNELHTYDLIDQAELLAARGWLNRSCGINSSEEIEVLREVLSRLPTAVEVQLHRLGHRF